MLTCLGYMVVFILGISATVGAVSFIFFLIKLQRANNGIIQK